MLGVLLYGTLPANAEAQVTERSRMPRGFNNHTLTAQIFQECPADGDGGSNRDLHLRKNRIDPIPDTGWVWVKFDGIKNLKWPRGADRVDRANWAERLTEAQRDSISDFEGTPVVVDGFLTVDNRTQTPVVAADEMGAESKNCDRTAEDQVDWHIWLTKGPGQTRANAVIVEVTPRMRQEGWTIAKLREIARQRRMVRVWGWLLLDQEHPEQLVASGNRNKVRGTLWEVHPIIEIEVMLDDGSFVFLKDWTR